MPEGPDVHLVMDNYATHKTPKVKAWLARRPHWHVHFTPTSACWINQVERWFAELTRKQLQRGVHRSTAELEADICAFNFGFRGLEKRLQIAFQDFAIGVARQHILREDDLYRHLELRQTFADKISKLLLSGRHAGCQMHDGCGFFA